MTGTLFSMADGRTRSGKLLAAVRRGDVDAARLLLEHGADPDARDKDGWAVLHKAAWNGYVELVHPLVERGADVNAELEDGQTPLFLACYAGHLGIIESLLSHGADVNVRDKWGRTPVEIVLSWHNNYPDRGEILALFQELAPEAYFSAFCTTTISP